MYRFTSVARAITVSVALASAAAAAAASYPGVGRPATPAEIKAWDIDVRPDFKGLPRGAGSVSQGEEVWDARCASCHGTFGESNQVFISPLTGGVTQEDIETGRARTLATSAPMRTTMSKLSTVSTLWDYINRAMPWDAPKSLTVGEVYAVTAYLLHLGDILPADFTLSDANIAEVQQRMPNRNGMTRDHGLWEIDGKPDVRNTACMRDCPSEGRITSFLPAHARAQHGNLAEQHRLVGPVRGVQTAATSSPAPAAAPESGRTLAGESGCTACHGIDRRIVGPGFADIAAKYKDEAGADARLVLKVKRGSAGAWGSTPMPPQGHVKEEDLVSIVQWILEGAK